MAGGAPGRLIAFCGLDGAGKSTQIERLAPYLRERGTVYLTTLPTKWFREDPAVRAYLNLDLPPTELVMSELALFSSADRLRHLRTELLPRLAAGEIIVSDRHILSAYTSFLANGFKDLDWLMSMNRLMPVPDLTIYLDVDPSVSCKRILARDISSRKRQELDQEFLARMRAAYLEQAWGPGYLPNYVIIDGSGSAEAIQEKIRTAIDALFAQV
jgi:dTMP kinase